MSIDIVKLAKVLAMTTSSHDGEALNAIRAANAMLAELGITWPELLHQLPYYRKAPAQQPSFWDGNPYQPYTTTSDSAYENMRRAHERYDEQQARDQQTRGERMREDMMRRQAEREHYTYTTTSDSTAEDTVDFRASVLKWMLIEQGVAHDQVENFMLFHATERDLAQWLANHRNDEDILVRRAWEAVTKYPLKLGPMHIAVLRHLMQTRP